VVPILIQKKTKACQNERVSLSGDDILILSLLENGGNMNLWLLLVWCQFGHETFDAVLELAIFAGVDERVDAAVGEHQYHGKVVEPASIVDSVANGAEKEDHLVRGPTNDESAADHSVTWL